MAAAVAGCSGRAATSPASCAHHVVISPLPFTSSRPRQLKVTPWAGAPAASSRRYVSSDRCTAMGAPELSMRLAAGHDGAAGACVGSLLAACFF